LLALAFATVLALLPAATFALPSFAQQTSQPCAACHVGSFGPQLTPFGRAFKLQGYALSAAGEIDQSEQTKNAVPLAAMLVTSFTQTRTDQSQAAGPHADRNDNFSVQEASLFLAGHLTDHIGAFAQGTYSDIDGKTRLDNVDVRYARTFALAEKPTIVGISLNNNPSVQDAWNTLPAWRFPYMASELVPEQAASTLLDGGLEHQVLGVTGYAYWNTAWYFELGGYRSLSHGALSALNVEDSAGRVSGVAPYWRLTWTHDIAGQTFSIGTVGLDTRLEPARVRGQTDKYRDLGVDASYTLLAAGKHVVTVNAAVTNEQRTLDASFAAGSSARPQGSLHSQQLNASYYYDGHYGLTVARFDNRGSRDAGLFAPAADVGSRTGKPDSRGTIMQADWTPFGQSESWAAPWVNLRLGIQYTWYDKFNGATHNYDGFGRNAGDNNTLFLFAWMAF
jgi:hypothetical protein